MNKATKIRLNYLIGGLTTFMLLWAIYSQIKSQLFHFDLRQLFSEGNTKFFFLAFLLMPVNLSLEIYKWKLLAGSAQPTSYAVAAKSFFAGLALSILTPNRIGEYPGRIVYLKQKNTPRLISVTFLGMFTQFLCLFIFGILGMVYFNVFMPGPWTKVILVCSVFCAGLVAIAFFYFEKWSSYIERFAYFRKFRTYTQLLKKFTIKEQLIILFLSMLRFCVYVSQYLLLMSWMHIELPLLAGFCLGCLFFFAMAVIPSIALAEMGIRGQVSILLFQSFTTNKIGILVATLVLWFINLIVPAIAGSILWLKMRLIK
ncbi:MAG TPA: lysylphosphatidylglycerol synthase domain-containing protein [Flavipsychrobacter sp.]|nr:lysylphosphatidylglycerol synthase domain-containing protein [Flavipsychrobacter sp.]